MLVAALEQGGVGGVLQRRTDKAGHSAQLVQQQVRVVGVELDAGQFGDAVQELARGGRQFDGPLVVADAGDGSGQPGDGVVGVDLRTVAGPAVRHEAQPGDALFGGLQEVGPLPADGGGEAAHLGDRFGGAFEEFGPVVHRVAGAVGAAGFLVGEEREDDVALGLFAGPGEAAQDGQDHGVHVLHVHGAAAPDQAVLQFAAERVHCPLVLQGGHHVEVAVDHQGTGGRIFTGHPGDHVGAAGRGFENFGGESHFFDQAGRVFGGRALPRTGSVAVVRGVDPDEVLADPDNFIFGQDVRHGKLLGFNGWCGALRLLHPAYPHAPCRRRFHVSGKFMLEFFSLLPRDAKRRKAGNVVGKHPARVAEWQTR